MYDGNLYDNGPKLIQIRAQPGVGVYSCLWDQLRVSPYRDVDVDVTVSSLED